MPARLETFRRGWASEPPAALGHELRRDRLLDVLDQRWDRRVVTLIAAAGHGKTTAVAQAVHANRVAPRGVDVWVTCAPDLSNAARLAEVATGLLGVEPLADDGPTIAVLGALRAQSPLDVCLILDDVHRLGPGSSGLELVAEVARDLPANAHLLISGRELPPLPLTRLRAGDDVLDVAAGELLFTDSEVDALAAATDRDPTAVADLGGWPALVRLALAAPEGAARDYLWEEVVEQLSPDDRRAVLALTTLGPADAATVGELCGCVVDGDALAQRVPLLRVDERTIRAHELWEEAITRVFRADDIDRMRRRAVDLLAAGDDVAAYGSLAARYGDGPALCDAALRLHQQHLSGLPVELAQAWLAAAPAEALDQPELRLLLAAVRHMADRDDAEADALVDAALDGFRRRGDARGQTMAVAQAATVAYARADHARLLDLALAAVEIPGADRDPLLANLVAGTEAAVLEVGGDLEGALAVLEAHAARPGSAPGEAILYQRLSLLLGLGRADEAVELADRHFARARTASLRDLPAWARWRAGDPSGFEEHGAWRPPEGGSSAHWRADHALERAVALWGCTGASAEIAAAMQLASELAPEAAGPMCTDVAVAAAIHAIVDHDEAGARVGLEAFVAEHDMPSPGVDVGLRRFLAVPFVCLPRLRAQWDATPMGPSHLRAREMAEVLESARAGHLTRYVELPPPELAHTMLPLPWSVELACRAAAAGNAAGTQLTEYLVDRIGQTVRDELVWQAEHGDDRVRAGAANLLASVPLPPDEILRIEVLGPFRLVVGGRVQDQPGLRRAHVRELLALLTVEPVLRRERAIDLLWGGRDAAAGARNLRVTLSHLRRLVEPGRGPGQAGFHLRIDGHTIRLVESGSLEVDLWEFRRLRRAGEAAAAAELWRGQALDELAGVADLSAELGAIHLELVDAALDAGERALADGDADLAARRAQQVLTVEPYTERAHRLAVAAHLQRGDRQRTGQALARARAAADELGAHPEPATLVLDRQAAARFGVAPTFA